MAESWGRLAKKHDPKTRKHQIDVCRKPGLGSIAVAEGEVCTIRQRGMCASNLEHRLRHVDTEDRARRADNPRDFDRGAAAPATDVDHPLSRLRCCSLKGGVTEGHHDAVELLLHRDPSLAQRTIPFCNLFGVVSRHGSLLKCHWRAPPSATRVLLTSS